MVRRKGSHDTPPPEDKRALRDNMTHKDRFYWAPPVPPKPPYQGEVGPPPRDDIPTDHQGKPMGRRWGCDEDIDDGPGDYPDSKL